MPWTWPTARGGCRVSCDLDGKRSKLPCKSGAKDIQRLVLSCVRAILHIFKWLNRLTMVFTWVLRGVAQRFGLLSVFMLSLSPHPEHTVFGNVDVAWPWYVSCAVLVGSRITF